MNRAVALAAAVILAAPLQGLATPLDDAIALVRQAHPVVQARQAEYRETTRQRDWSSDITLGWTQRGTAEGGAAGPNAGIRVTIPLFDRSHELRSVSARREWVESSEALLAAFLDAVAEHDQLVLDVHEADTLRHFWRDRLAYQQRQVEDGLQEPDSLWPVAESMQRADLDYLRRSRRLEALRERVAREYGGAQWTTLQALLVEHANSTRP